MNALTATKKLNPDMDTAAILKARRTSPKMGSKTPVDCPGQTGDVFPRGWSGVVYLSPNPKPWSGTSIWRHKDTDTCIASHGVRYYRDPDTLDHFELAFLVENRYNRLLLFRENVLHRVETGFGMGKNARLTQTFFFQTERPKLRDELAMKE